MGKEKYTGSWPNWVLLTGEIIALHAKTSAWKYGTNKSKYTYKDGDPFKNSKQSGTYYEYLEAAYPDRRGKWGHQPACGASCDVFASTSAKSTGYDSKLPRGLDGQYKHFAQSPLWEDVKAYKASQRRPGDYILYKNKGTGGHACIASGDGYTYEAGYNSKRYGCTVKAKNYKKSSYKSIAIYRPTKALRKYVQRGDMGEQVARVQAFLIWAGFLGGAADGGFGANTEKAVKAFQTAAGLTADGKFGEGSVKAAQEWTISTKERYTGTIPTKTLKRGIKNKTQVKQLQDFLNWYDNGYELIRDDLFGPRTENAVMDFQKREGLVVDGIFGPACRARAKIVEK